MTQLVWLAENLVRGRIGFEECWKGGKQHVKSIQMGSRNVCRYSIKQNKATRSSCGTMGGGAGGSQVQKSCFSFCRCLEGFSQEDSLSTAHISCRLESRKEASGSTWRTAGAEAWPPPGCCQCSPWNTWVQCTQCGFHFKNHVCERVGQRLEWYIQKC